jgi:phage/plasmid-like protein (TIGR03299 family)
MPAFAITSNLDWTISKRPLVFPLANGELQTVPDKYGIVRDDNDSFLGVVSRDYEVVQNSELLNLINPMVEEGLLTVQNMGYLNNGSKVFAQARINQDFQVVGEDYRAFITLLNGHTGNASVAIGATATRVICGNTFSMAYSDLSERYRHQVGVNERVLESKAVLNYVNGAMAKYAQSVEKLATTPCSSTQFRNALEEIYLKDANKIRNIEVLNNLFYSGAGNEGRTMYDALNSVTDYSSNRSRKTESGRFNYTNFGKGATINRRAMAVLTELVPA